MITLPITAEEPDNVISRVIRGDTVDYYFAEDTNIDQSTFDNDVYTTSKIRTGLKESRSQNVKSIIVTTGSGNVFDGDEISQNRMTRAVIVMDDVETTQWTLADNSVVQVTKAELLEALRLSGQAQSGMWFIG